MTKEFRSGCLVCGADLEYLSAPVASTCFYCHEETLSDVRCIEGHFICDSCHSASANKLIENYCLTTQLKDPLEIAVNLMRNPKLKMHGPEHHLLVPLVLISAFYNTIGDEAEKASNIHKAVKRAEKVPGGVCGFWGNCGAAVGAGIFMSIVTGATPVSVREWQLSNEISAKSLMKIARHGGPRCCKRNSFLAIRETANFLKKNFGVDLSIRKNSYCEFSAMNRECKEEACPFHPN